VFSLGQAKLAVYSPLVFSPADKVSPDRLMTRWERHNLSTVRLQVGVDLSPSKSAILYHDQRKPRAVLEARS